MTLCHIDLELDGDALVCSEPVFGGTTDVKAKFTGEGPYIVLVRPKSFAAEPSGGGSATVEDLDVPDLGFGRPNQPTAMPPAAPTAPGSAAASSPTCATGWGRLI